MAVDREEREEYGRHVENLRTRLREVLAAKRGLRIEDLMTKREDDETEGEDDHE